MYRIIYRSADLAEDGLYHDDKQIASAWLLRRYGYSHEQMLDWTQKALANVARKFS